MLIDNYNLHGYLLMCIDAYNLKVISIEDYGLYGFLKCLKYFKNSIKIGGCEDGVVKFACA